MSAQDFIALVVLVSFLHLPDLAGKPYQLIEYFSGKARVSKMAARSGLRVASYDISYDNRPTTWKNGLQRARKFMDINGEAGFVLL